MSSLDPPVCLYLPKLGLQVQGLNSGPLLAEEAHWPTEPPPQSPIPPMLVYNIFFYCVLLEFKGLPRPRIALYYCVIVESGQNYMICAAASVFPGGTQSMEQHMFRSSALVASVNTAWSRSLSLSIECLDRACGSSRGWGCGDSSLRRHPFWGVFGSISKFWASL